MRKYTVLLLAVASTLIMGAAGPVRCTLQDSIVKVETDAQALLVKINAGLVKEAEVVKSVLDGVCGTAVPAINAELAQVQPLLPEAPGSRTRVALININAALATANSVCGNYQAIDTSSGVSAIISQFKVGYAAYKNTKSNIATVKAALFLPGK